MPPEVRTFLLVAAHSELVDRLHMFEMAKQRGGSEQDLANCLLSIQYARDAVNWLEDSYRYAMEG